MLVCLAEVDGRGNGLIFFFTLDYTSPSYYSPFSVLFILHRVADSLGYPRGLWEQGEGHPGHTFTHYRQCQINTSLDLGRKLGYPEETPQNPTGIKPPPLEV